jgi:predicted ATPase
MIHKLSVHRYRSIGGIDFLLGPITVLVGPNGSGKSNIVDAVRFFRDMAAHGLEHAIDQRGGISIIRQYSTRRPFVMTFGLEITTPLNMALRTGQNFDKYLLKVSGPKNSAKIDREEILWSESYREWIDEAEFVEEFRSQFIERNAEGEINHQRPAFSRSVHSKKSLSESELALGKPTFGLEPDYSIIGGPIVSFLRRMRFASVYPNIMREPRRLETDSNLKEDCSNWGSIVRQMRSRRPGLRALERIFELMRQVLPELETIVIKNIGGYVVPQFKVRHLGGKASHFLDPIQLSDGTLRLFGLLLHLYQEPRPSLLAIEEPEQTIHPALLEVLVSAFREASKSTQLIITTHSPHLLDYFDVESIRVTSLTNGETRLSKIGQSQIETVKEGLMTLSEIMSLDGLRPGHQDD